MKILADGPRTAGDPAARFELSRPSVAEHLKILRRAALVRDESSGRQRFYRLETAPLEQAGEWLHPFKRFWRGRPRTMADLLAHEEDTQ